MAERIYRICPNDKRYLEFKDENGKWMLFPKDEKPKDFEYLVELPGIDCLEETQQVFASPEEMLCTMSLNYFFEYHGVDSDGKYYELPIPSNLPIPGEDIWGNLIEEEVDDDILEECSRDLLARTDMIVAKSEIKWFWREWSEAYKIKNKEIICHLVFLHKRLRQQDSITLLSLMKNSRTQGDLLRTVCYYLLLLLYREIVPCFCNIEILRRLSDTDKQKEIYRDEEFLKTAVTQFVELYQDINCICDYHKAQNLVIPMIKILDILAKTIVNDDKVTVSSLMTEGEIDGFPINIGKCNWILDYRCNGISSPKGKIWREHIRIPDFVAEAAAYDNLHFSANGPENFWTPHIDNSTLKILETGNAAYRDWHIVAMAYWWGVLAWNKLNRYYNESEFSKDILTGDSRDIMDIYRRLNFFDKNIDRKEINLPPEALFTYLIFDGEYSKAASIDIIKVAIHHLQHLFGDPTRITSAPLKN